ncbi:MAG: citrate synthase [Planctomycetota bacterium]|nr:citrate synthase [Planctomycetota bacterium]
MTQSKVAPKGGLEGVAVANSAIGKIDGTVGELRYCGYLITDLADHSDFTETVYLLWHGVLPTKGQYDQLKAELCAKREIPALVVDLLRRIADKQAPMDALRTAASLLSIEDGGGDDADREANLLRAVRLTAQFPTIVAAYDRLRDGQEPIAPRDDLGHAANFLYMLTGEEPNGEIAKMLDVCLVLHAEHGFNASTFAGRVTAATLSDMYSAVCSAIGTLKGPLHGGANTAVMQTLQSIGSADGVEAYLDEALARKEKVMGFGHRVYKVVDPRAIILRKFSQRTAEITGDARWFEMSTKLEGLMKERKGIDMNVDFYSASTYYSMGIKPDLFTPIFAISRVSGWIAHILEQLANNRLIRPRSNWVGQDSLDYVFIDQR